MNTETPPPTRHAPIDLWRIAEAFMQTLHMLFGEPKHVAARSGLTALAHKELASWLACAEALLRRLLLIEAAALPRPTTRQRVRTPRQRVRRRMEFWAEKPEDWRVSFRCFPSDRRLPAGTSFNPHTAGAHGNTACRQDAGAPKNQFRNSWPLAERYEAILRVFENPEPYARRLSRRLHASPLTASKLLGAPPEAERRIDRFGELTQAAANGRDRFCDSS